jgi:hypothetical protein
VNQAPTAHDASATDPITPTNETTTAAGPASAVSRPSVQPSPVDAPVVLFDIMPPVGRPPVKV